MAMNVTRPAAGLQLDGRLTVHVLVVLGDGGQHLPDRTGRSGLLTATFPAITDLWHAIVLLKHDVAACGQGKGCNRSVAARLVALPAGILDEQLK